MVFTEAANNLAVAAGKMVKNILQMLYDICLVLWSNFSKNIINKPFEPVNIPVSVINHKLSYNIFSRRKISSNLFLRLKLKPTGLILDGDWDQDYKIKNIEEIPAVIGMYERFTEGRTWEDTVYYTDFQNTVRNNKLKRRCRNWDEYKEKHVSRWEILFSEIKENGFGNYKLAPGKTMHFVDIAVSRNGDVLLVDGRHRLAIANILKIKHIPARVCAWHKEFINKLQNEIDIADMTPSSINAKLFTAEPDYKLIQDD